MPKRKDFGADLGVFDGEIVEANDLPGVGVIARIRYSDGDEEEMGEEELAVVLCD